MGELKKVKQQAITKARQRVGAQRHQITISERAWEAIQAGALNGTKLRSILNYADMDQVRQMATPKVRKEMTSAMLQRARSYRENGKTNAEIAAALGVSASTVSKYLSGE